MAVPRRKTKQAPALNQRMWQVWLEWLKTNAGPRMYFVIFITGAFGLRTGEVVKLRRDDIQLNAAIPRIVVRGEDLGGRKSPGDVYIRQKHFETLRMVLKDGITTEITKGHKHGKGVKRTITRKSSWMPPRHGYIFLGREKCSRTLTYHAVWCSVKKYAKAFLVHCKQVQLCDDSKIAELTPHSGRATLITELMGQGLSTGMSMKYARHAPNSYRVHLKYSRLTLEDVKDACDMVTPPTGEARYARMSTKQLIHLQNQIAKELVRRTKR